MTEALRALWRRRFLTGALAVSVFVNAFVIGAAVAEYMGGDRHRGRSGLLRLEVQRVGEHLPPEYNERLREHVRASLPDLRPGWRRLRELRREINALAAEPHPDRAAINARLAEVRTITSSMQQSVQARIFDAVLAFPADVRATLGQDIEGR